MPGCTILIMPAKESLHESFVFVEDVTTLYQEP